MPGAMLMLEMVGKSFGGIDAVKNMSFNIIILSQSAGL